MAMANDSSSMMANRWGANLKFYQYAPNSTWKYGTAADGGTLEPTSKCLYTLDFANEVSHEITSGVTYATGGQAHSNMIGFKDATTGTLTITTQITTDIVRAIAAGMDITNYQEGQPINYMNDEIAIIPQSYVIIGETSYQDAKGQSHVRKYIYYKATVSPAASETFTGDGDPQELEIEFELGTNDALVVQSSITDPENYEGTGYVVSVTGDGLSDSTITLATGSAVSLSASVADAEGNTVDGATAAWFVGGTAGVVSCEDGVVTAIAEGTATVTVEFTNSDGYALGGKTITVVVTAAE